MKDAHSLSRHARVALPLAEIVVEGARRFGYSLRELRGERRTAEHVQARRWIIARAFSLKPIRRSDKRYCKTHYSYEEIGRALNRDHTTIYEALHYRIGS